MKTLITAFALTLLFLGIAGVVILGTLRLVSSFQ